ncbi:MAG: hydantoinase/oxoprolinase family protein [Xanthobacteraceae bacterium]
MTGRLEIGVDIGGTFTDVVMREPGKDIKFFKLPTTRKDPSEAVVAALKHIQSTWGLQPNDLVKFAHGTTIATNAVLERKGAAIGIITTKGFRDILEIGRQSRRQMYDVVLEPQPPVFLAPRRFRQEVSERVAPSGEVLTKLDESALRHAVDKLVKEGVQSIAIVFLFAFANPAHERRAKQLISEWYPDLAISISSEVDPHFREYERTVATAFDAYVKPTVAKYLENLERSLKEEGVGAPLQVMQSRGGLTVSEVARMRPIRLFLSGPAGGVVGGKIAGTSANAENIITIDIGGTSADIALISKRKPLIRPEGIIGDYAVRVAMVDVNTIGSGGGSIARVEGGSLRVGPHSAGSEPGPACYGRGGKQATVCDASVLLGYLDPDYFAGGSLKLNPALAHEAVQKDVAQPLGISLERAALGIHRVLNAQMAEGIRAVSVRQGVDQREFSLMPLGGAGGLHATALATELKMTKVVIPRIPGVLAAAGLLAAPIEHEVSAAFSQPLAQLSVDAVNQALAQLDEAASKLMQAERVQRAEVTITYYADVCFIGQSYALELNFDPRTPGLAERLYEDFLIAHDRIYGHAVRVPAKLVALRAIHQAAGSDTIEEMKVPPTSAPIELGTRKIWVSGFDQPVEARVLNRAALPVGFKFSGPALVQQSDTTTLVEPGWNGVVDDAANVILTKG